MPVRRRAKGWPSVASVGDDLLAVIGLASAWVVALSLVLRAGPAIVDGRMAGVTASGLPPDLWSWWPVGLMLGASTLLFGVIVWLAQRAGRAAMVFALLAVCWLTVGPEMPFAIAPTGLPAHR